MQFESAKLCPQTIARSSPSGGRIRTACEYAAGHDGPHLSAGYRWKLTDLGGVEIVK